MLIPLLTHVYEGNPSAPAAHFRHKIVLQRPKYLLLFLVRFVLTEKGQGMDRDAVLRSRVRMMRLPTSASLVEFVRDAGVTRLVRYGLDPHDVRPFVIHDDEEVAGHFHEVAARYMQIVERFYDELSFPRLEPVFPNVRAAIIQSSAVLDMSFDWLSNCKAREKQAKSVAIAVFLTARDLIGPLATSRRRYGDDEIDAAGHSLGLAVMTAAERYRCAPLIA